MTVVLRPMTRGQMDSSGFKTRWIQYVAVLTIGVMTLLWFCAGQLFVLASEGFPKATWPAPGNYATVAGSNANPNPPDEIPPPRLAADRFAQSGGRALLVDQRSELIVETYGEGLHRDTRLNSFSLVKGLVGALVLRAIAEQKIDGIDMPIQAYLGLDAPNVTVREALGMISGLVPDHERGKTAEDAGFSPFGPLARVHAFGIDAMMSELRVDDNLRGTFRYQSINTALLGRLVEQVFDRPLPDLLSEYIWQPAGAKDAYWRRYPDSNQVSAYCCLFARPLDWVLVGRYLLDNGTQDNPLLPTALWQDFLMPALTEADRAQGVYGLHVRHDVLDRAEANIEGPFAYFMGHKGQMLYFLPAQDTIVVRFGENMQLLHSTLYELLDEPN